MAKTKYELSEMLEKSKIRFNDPEWIRDVVQEHFDLKRESFKEYFDNIEDYNKCINQLKVDLENEHNIKLKIK